VFIEKLVIGGAETSIGNNTYCCQMKSLNVLLPLSNSFSLPLGTADLLRWGLPGTSIAESKSAIPA
jgi:hypothetical protein